jgi:uncharacterized membrane-anchored protein YhcB (DUF1043 family)
MSALVDLPALIAQIGTSGAAVIESNTGVIVAATGAIGVILAALIATLGQRTTKRLEGVESGLGVLGAELGGRIDTLATRFEGSVDRFEGAVDRLAERVDHLYRDRPALLDRKTVEEVAAAALTAAAMAAEARGEEEGPPTRQQAAKKAAGAATKKAGTESGRLMPRPARRPAP